MNEKNILLNKIIEIIQNNPDLKATLNTCNITLASTLNDDLGFDSIMSIAFLCELQTEHTFLNEFHLAKWQTLEDCIVSIMKEKTV